LRILLSAARFRWRSTGRVFGGSLGIFLVSPRWIPAAAKWNIEAPRQFNTAEASRLLEERGWKYRGGTKIREKAGRLFKFPLFYIRGDDLALRTAQTVGNDLFDIGLRAVLEPVDLAELS